MGIRENYLRVRKDVDRIAAACGRRPEEIQIVAVSKTHPSQVIQDAIQSGLTLFGENRIQEARLKIPDLSGDFTFHLVGHLQSNKAREAVKLFDLIHSLDKAGTAEAVNREAEKVGKIQKVLVQVNTSAEESKSGIEPEAAPGLCGDILQMKNLELQGLMTIGPLTGDELRIRQSFILLRDLLGQVNTTYGIALKELSMGMSSDYRMGVEEGATLVRIGSAIFGVRI